ncbi:MAG: hypothetical protein ABJA70_14485 [Chryseolinea sp.]
MDKELYRAWNYSAMKPNEVAENCTIRVTASDFAGNSATRFVRLLAVRSMIEQA